MRKILARLIRRGWNEHVLTSDDFDQWCEWEGVEILTARMKWDGLYFIRHNQPTILLNQQLTGITQQIVQWHELGHHLLHVPSARFFNYGMVDKAEYQAHLIGEGSSISLGCDFFALSGIERRLPGELASALFRALSDP